MRGSVCVYLYSKELANVVMEVGQSQVLHSELGSQRLIVWGDNDVAPG